MLKRCLMIVGIITITLVVSSCSRTSPIYQPTLLDRNWGRSYETVNYLQTLNPEAGKNLDPVVGLDGTAASHGVKKYQQSFKEKETSEIVNILKLQ